MSWRPVSKTRPSRRCCGRPRAAPPRGPEAAGAAADPIPLAIRDKLGLLPDTEVQFEMVGNAVRLRKAKGGPSRGRALVARLRGRARAGLSTDEILALTRG